MLFEEYENKMEQLKQALVTLKDAKTFNARFLGTIQDAIDCIEGAWNAFPDDYKDKIGREYASNVIGVMLSATQKYVDDFSNGVDGWEEFQNSCRQVGDRINYYTSRANHRTTSQNTVENLPPEKHEPVVQDNHVNAEPDSEIITTKHRPPRKKNIPQKQQQNDTIPERVMPPPEIQRETPPQSPETPPITSQTSQPPKKKVKKRPAPTMEEEKEESEIPHTLKNLFVSGSPEKSPMEQRFTDAKKCVIFVNFLDTHGKVISSYGMKKGLSLRETQCFGDEESLPENHSAFGWIKGLFSRKYQYQQYFFVYRYHVRFNSNNFIKMPILTGNQENEEDIPLSHLVYGKDEKTGSFIKIAFIPEKESFEVTCGVENDKSQEGKQDFLSGMLEKFYKTESVSMNTNEQKNHKVTYELNEPVYLTYELGRKQENQDSPDVTTQIVIYLEF